MTEIKARYFRYFRQSRFIPGVLKLEQSIFRTKIAYLAANSSSTGNGTYHFHTSRTYSGKGVRIKEAPPEEA